MPLENLALLTGTFLLMAVPAVFGVALLTHVAHARGLTVGEYCTCFLCLLAEKLDRHHGRHRMEDLYHLQGTIRADFHRLRPDR
ncbi:hypothetical protein AB0I28_20230 [Phytomonospora sp. NPDC050363]|uniref:hypothetical protein n=1 Tax=Phytomonospora sp. NPDC050363 TaxID=3155642 RepID=UPI0033CCF514